jgi:hypothetical protein
MTDQEQAAVLFDQFATLVVRLELHARPAVLERFEQLVRDFYRGAEPEMSEICAAILAFARSQEPTNTIDDAIDICPVCREPAHASESDELSRHAECQGSAVCDSCGDVSNSEPGLGCGRALGRDADGDESLPPYCKGTYR